MAPWTPKLESGLRGGGRSGGAPLPCSPKKPTLPRSPRLISCKRREGVNDRDPSFNGLSSPLVATTQNERSTYATRISPCSGLGAGRRPCPPCTPARRGEPRTDRRQCHRHIRP